MKRFALALMFAALAALVATPAFACGGHKSAGKDCPATCPSKAACDGHKCKAKCCPSHPGCVCPSKGKLTKADAAAGDNMVVTTAVAKSGTKVSVELTGAGCPAAKSGSSSKTGHTCTPEEKAACMARGGPTTVKLLNGHPALSAAEALKCEEGSKVVFLSVDKMTCNGCVSHVTKTLGNIDGICAVEVDLKKASATVVFHTDKVKTEDMVTAITKAGYVASMKTECSEDMKALFGDDYKEKCLKSCANMCKGKQDTKKSES